MTGQLEEPLQRHTLNRKNKLHINSQSNIKHHRHTPLPLLATKIMSFFNLPRNTPSLRLLTFNMAFLHPTIPSSAKCRESYSFGITLSCKSTNIQLAFVSTPSVQDTLGREVSASEGRECLADYQNNWIIKKRQLELIAIISAITNQLKQITTLNACGPKEAERRDHTVLTASIISFIQSEAWLFKYNCKIRQQE